MRTLLQPTRTRLLRPDTNPSRGRRSKAAPKAFSIGRVARVPRMEQPSVTIESLHRRPAAHATAAAAAGDSSGQGDVELCAAGRGGGQALEEEVDQGEACTGEEGEQQDPVATGQADRTRLLQSYSYLGVFVAQGLAVGITGPALPWITQQLPGDANLAPAFAARLVGGLLGSSGGGWALHSKVPGNAVLALGGLLAAAGVAGLRVASSSMAVGCALVVLDCGCGLVQVANTLTAWIQPEKSLMFWLNVLNGRFGVGTLLAPAAVAAVATLTGSHDAGVRLALTYLPLIAVAFSGVALFIPSPSQPAKNNSDVSSKDGAVRWLAVGLTCIALGSAVGAETTFAAFLATYAAAQRTTGVLDVGHRQADMITSAFWLTFTVGRLGVGTLSSLFAGAQVLVLWVQLATLAAGLLLILACPSSSIVLWAGAVLVGGGVAGLFAGFMAQLAARTPIDTQVGGLTGVAIMCGIATWQSFAASVDPSNVMRVVGLAVAVTATCQAALHMLLRPKAGSTLCASEDTVNTANVGSDLPVLIRKKEAPRDDDTEGERRGLLNDE